ncbi:unnamed protein product, partial [Prorocentrum cordatum]
TQDAVIKPTEGGVGDCEQELVEPFPQSKIVTPPDHRGSNLPPKESNLLGPHQRSMQAGALAAVNSSLMCTRRALVLRVAGGNLADSRPVLQMPPTAPGQAAKEASDLPAVVVMANGTQVPGVAQFGREAPRPHRLALLPGIHLPVLQYQFVQSLREVSEWPLWHVMRVANDKRETHFPDSSCSADALYSLRQVIENDALSTAFSGIDAPGTAYSLMGQAVADLIKAKCGESIPVPRASHIHAIEYDAACKAELMAAPHGPQCLFSNIVEFGADAIQPWLLSVGKAARHNSKNSKTNQNAAVGGVGVYDALCPTVLAGFAVKNAAHCCVHGRTCFLKSAHAHIAGTPCTDESKMGHQMGGLDGNTTLYFLIWVGLRIRLQEPVIVQENVKGFSTGFLTHLLGKWYDVEDVVLQSTSYGFPAMRTRKFVVLTHKFKVAATRCSLTSFTRALERTTSLTWKAFFVDDADSLKDELRWALARKLKQDRNLSKSEQAAELDVAMARFDAGASETFEKLLLAFEVGTLSEYRARYGGKPWSLHQNPATGRSHAGSRTALPCLIRNSSLIWGDDVAGGMNRWLTPRELLASQGFPTFAWMYGADQCSFLQPRWCVLRLTHAAQFFSLVARPLNISHQMPKTPLVLDVAVIEISDGEEGNDGAAGEEAAAEEIADEIHLTLCSMAELHSDAKGGPCTEVESKQIQETVSQLRAIETTFASLAQNRATKAAASHVRWESKARLSTPIAKRRPRALGKPEDSTESERPDLS